MHARLQNLIVLITGVIAYGSCSLMRGQDASFDLKLYHLYNGYSRLHGRFDFDFAVSGMQTFLNPTLDTLSYVLVEHLSARGVGFVLGAIQGVSFWLLFIIARRLVPLVDQRARAGVALLCAALGMYGAIGLTEVGTLHHDLTTSVLVLAALALVFETHLITAGIVLGLAVGMKNTLAIYAIALCGSLLLDQKPWRARVFGALRVGVGIVCGFLLVAGSFMLELQHTFGSPLFPFYNAIFKSPYFDPINYHTGIGMAPRTLLDALIMPFRWLVTSSFAMQRSFRDVRFPILFLLAMVFVVVKIGRRKRTEHVWILWFFLIGFAVWMKAFSIYRYLAPLEQLAPCLIVVMLAALLREPKRLIGATLVIFAGIALTLIPPDFGRIQWGARFLEVSAPPIARPSETVVLVASRQPIAYVVPGFPQDVRFVGIANTLVKPTSTKLNEQIRTIVSAADKDFFLLTFANEKKWAATNLARFSMILAPDGCSPVHDAFGEEVILCRAERTNAALATFTVAPLQLCRKTKSGVATFTWKVPGVQRVDIHVGSPGGRLWITADGEGSQSTGPWAQKAMKFFLLPEGSTDPDEVIAVATIDEAIEAPCP